MGFLDSLASCASKGMKAMKEYNDKCSSTKEKYRRLSDDELWDIVKGNSFFNKSFTDKTCAHAVLKERGLV